MQLPQELRSLVGRSVAILGDVIRRELGDDKYAFIEGLRAGMAEIRGTSIDFSFGKLQAHYRDLEALGRADRRDVAHSYTLMLELMNACENAYRIHRLSRRDRPAPSDRPGPHSLTYVLTAHPTEARSPQNIEIFHQIQDLLVNVLGRGDREFSSGCRDRLFHLLELAWRTPVVRTRAPRVKDEADHIYSLLFRDDVLFSLIDQDERTAPFYVRSWVGGDKDGHPGVDERALIESLTLSRRHLLRAIGAEIGHVRGSLGLLPKSALPKKVAAIEAALKPLRTLRTGDAKRVVKVKERIQAVRTAYEREIGADHPSLVKMAQLARTFPGLVVPLELRESSDVLMSAPKERSKLAIYKMLATVGKISAGGDPRWYARGLIISMCESLAHIQAAGEFEKATLGGLRLPIIPLFEEARTLKESAHIVAQMLGDHAIADAAKAKWDGRLEIMVGYSDSAKEAGVLASRLAIASALPELERVITAAKLTPIFFHGSGGSIDRGGGSIEDQTAWWPRAALLNYKVTVQGEMVERSLASPEIAERQLETIGESVSRGLARPAPSKRAPALDAFADRVSRHYRETVTSPEFLREVEGATPYPYLSALKIGSRPSKRATRLTVRGLRAIPWILCWTQTRVLFPTWWGFGSAWAEADENERAVLKDAFRNEPAFTSYVKALGFTLAKVRLNVWKLYLTEAGMADSFGAFADEYALTDSAYREVCGQDDLLWFRPWLGESILLRSPMIHPLNLLQILAQKSGDLDLLRLTVTGISSGMLTTG